MTTPALADVDRVEVLERVPLAGAKTFGNVGAYERIRGRLYFAVDAAAPENQAVTDLRLAPQPGWSPPDQPSSSATTDQSDPAEHPHRP